MRIITLESMPDLDALVSDICKHGEPISLQRGATQLAVIVSRAEYDALRRLEENLLDKLDIKETEEALQDPKWIDWDQLQKEFKP